MAVRLLPSTNPWFKTRLSANAAARLNGVTYKFLPPKVAIGRPRADSRTFLSRTPEEPPNSSTATVCSHTKLSRSRRASAGPSSEVGKLGEVFPVALGEPSGELHKAFVGCSSWLEIDVPGPGGDCNLHAFLEA